MKKYDAIMIGFGKGSKTLASRLAKEGKHVAMIEKSDQMYGGTCINVGCIPSKAMIKMADRLSYSESITNKQNLTAKLRKKNFDMLNNLDNIDVYTAEASFIDNHNVQIKGEGIEETITGEYIYINTGSYSLIPNIEGVEKTHNIFTSTGLMNLEILPQKLAIVGGGYIGMEFASMYARYGAEVDVFETSDRLLGREDKDIVDSIRSVLEKQGVTFHFNTKVAKFSNENDDVVISYSEAGTDKTNKYNAVLLATGRKAATEALKLENTDVEIDARGNVIVDETLKTGADNIYAMGDVKGGLQFTYISLDDYRIVYSQVYGDKSRTTANRGNIAYSMFTTPSFSRVGLSDQEAEAKHLKVKTSTLQVAGIPRANVVKHTDGMMKAIVDADTDEILGCVLFCDSSEEMINLITLAMNHHVKASELANHIFTHPTMSEALNDLFSNLK